MRKAVVYLFSYRNNKLRGGSPKMKGGLFGAIMKNIGVKGTPFYTRIIIARTPNERVLVLRENDG
jgi:hypothetical protein